jgi:hypothetical protein
MSNPEPVSTTNLDQYGHQPLPWQAVIDRLATVADGGRDVFTVLGTVRPEGRPTPRPSVRCGSKSVVGVGSAADVNGATTWSFA